MNVSDSLEAYIALILTVEFFYDLIWNNREARLKRRKREKAKMDKQELRERTSLVIQEAKGPVRDMPEASIPVQEKAKS